MTNPSTPLDRQSGLVVDVLATWVQQAPDAPALVLLEDGQRESARLSRAELHLRSQQLAAALRDHQYSGERVLLAFHSSVDYVVTLLACFYAGVIAVPLYPPRQNWHARRLAAIARDAGAQLVLTSDALRDEVHQRLTAQPAAPAEDKATVALRTLGIGSLLARTGLQDSPSTGLWMNRDIDPHSLAYLQYTSGSTADPKGVMVSQANLLHNINVIGSAIGRRQADSEAFVSWLPIYHDMGLVMGVMLPLLLGGTAVLMPPAAFVQQPVNWLRAIQRYRAWFSAAPNFAYDLCVARVSAEQATTLDLSSWRVAVNGAEPLWAPTFDAFQTRFAVAAARPTLLCGAYGMAEATLVVTLGGPADEVPRLRVARAALESNLVQEVGVDHGMPDAACCTLVSSGPVNPAFDLRIVDPQAGRALKDCEVGEIWLRGPSIAAGYWQRAAESAATFGAHLNEAPEAAAQGWLRTGDLGFVHAGQLYVTGRLKDLVIVRGANHYPQDLERSAEQAHPACRTGGFNAAFTQDVADGPGRVVLVQEVERAARRQIDVEQAGRAIADAITREHGIDIDSVVFVPPATVPKTSSGKVQRRACRQAVAANEWVEIGRWQRQETPPTSADVDVAGESVADLKRWLQQCVAKLAGRAAADIDTTRPLLELGLDSVKLVELTALAGDALRRTLPPTLAFDHPSIDALVRHLSTAEDHDTPPAAAASEQALPVAIIGMACRLPGADSVQAFWEFLCGDHDPVREVPPQRARLTGWKVPADAARRHVGLLDDVDSFDAAAFGISPREARQMDPQQRLLLQAAWHALEHAQIAPDRLQGSATGVFIGISSNDYYRLQRASSTGLDAHAGTGGALSIAANRLSYVFGLQGPSMAIDTACSSSLVALHQACLSLANGDCTLALAGGVNLVLCDDLGTVFENAGMLAADGRCKTFDAAANGYVRGEGCGVLVLKRLDHALRDGNPVLAVVSGTAVNQDGASNGLTAPNGLAQQQVVARALQRAGADSASIDLVETHGTGTPLGDPIEVGALRAVFDSAQPSGSQPAARRPCWLGAVKTRIGHLEAAAGVVGVIKTVLSLQHGVIPANAHFKTLNPAIDLDGSRLQPASTPVVWPARRGQPRRAGVSSFGFGGTNAHVIIEESPGPQRSVTRQGHGAAVAPPCVLHTLSAANPAALRVLAGAHADALGRMGDAAQAAALCAVANSGRATLSERLSLCAPELGLVLEGLRAFAAGAAWPTGLAHSQGSGSRRPRLAFLFTGQGAHYAGMGASLMGSEPVFRAAIERCDALLQPLLGHSVKALLWGAETALLADTRYAQPTLAALQLALVALWSHHGVRPDLVCGHSVGEYAAAVCAGMLDEATMLHLVVARSRLMSSVAPRGAMLSVADGGAQALAVVASLLPQLDVAARNGPRQTVLSGDEGQIMDALALLRGRGLLASRLAVSHAFHSRLMDPILSGFASDLTGVEFKRPSIQLVPTGGSVDTDMGQADYWVQQIRRTVCFGDALLKLKASGVGAFIEIGPGSTLLSLARQTLGNGVHIASLSGAMHDASEQMHAALGAWWAAGGAARLDRLPSALTTTLDPRSMQLPLRVFEGSRHWFDTPTTSHIGEPGALASVPQDLGLALQPVPLADAGLRVYESRLDGACLDLLRQHVVAGQPVMPAAAWLALGCAAAARAAPGRPCQLSGLQFEQPLLLEAPTRVQTWLSRSEGAANGAWALRIAYHDRAQDRWLNVLRANLDPAAPIPDLIGVAADDGAGWTEQSAATFYASWAHLGLAWGPGFQLLTRLSSRGNEVRATLALPQGGLGFGETLNPAWLDGALQCVGAAMSGLAAQQQRVPVPARIERVWITNDWPAAACNVRAQVRPLGEDGIEADLQLCTAEGRLCMLVQGLSLRWVDTLTAPAAAMPVLPAEADASELALHVRDWAAPEPGAASSSQEWNWHVVAAQPAAAQELAAALQQAGLNASALPPALGQAQEVVRAWLAGHRDGMRSGLLLLASAPVAHAEVDEASRLAAAIADCRALQSLLLACDSAALHAPTAPRLARLCLLAGAGAPSPRDAAMSALWRSAALEVGGLELQLGAVVGPAAQPQTAALLALALCSEEREWRVQAGALQVPHWKRATAPPLPGPTLAVDGGVLVTGGTGALGFQLAQRLVARGQRRLWLCSRHAQATAAQRQRIEAWRAQGCVVELLSCDLADRAAVQRLIDTVHTPAHALRGVVHAAGALADAALNQLAETHWQTALGAKVWGALWLSELTQPLPLAYFVAYSSAASALGSAGQCNYAAANGLLEGLVAQGQGGPSGRRVAIQWGPWRGDGMAQATLSNRALAQRGIGLLDGEAALDAFELALAGDAPVWLVGRYDWPRAAPRRFLRAVPGQPSASPTLQQVAAMPAAARQAAVRHEFGVRLAQVLGVEPSTFTDQDAAAFDQLRLSTLGLDSLMAMEMRNHLRGWLGVDLPAHLLIGQHQVGDALAMVNQKLLLRSLSEPAPDAPDSPGDMEVEVL